MTMMLSVRRLGPNVARKGSQVALAKGRAMAPQAMAARALSSLTTTTTTTTTTTAKGFASSQWINPTKRLSLPSSTSSLWNTTLTTRSFASQPLGNVMQGQQEQQKSFLEQFSVDLTAQAQDDKLDPIIGRHDEIRRCLQILARRSKNNPILIGEAGVGKTGKLNFVYCTE